ncbi:hypothetical protein K503DRAFT_507025 [Rhizopogon vinicolor AM-OR11-026]|uniref:Uncharacterized protein n=1 Tax=Rhizopogon vinicolor AM-OR11-026 TaxID=1314800 RepID=A0A1B7N986_9AGAM|nr:hypothetical protein K503DRAFT_507025 [Rhizopogon vinicolor AM-OR11-026]
MNYVPHISANFSQEIPLPSKLAKYHVLDVSPCVMGPALPPFENVVFLYRDYLSPLLTNCLDLLTGSACQPSDMGAEDVLTFKARHLRECVILLFAPTYPKPQEPLLSLRCHARTQTPSPTSPKAD